MEISRRKFFFFGLAAGVGLYLPDYKISLATPEQVNVINNRLMTLDQILALESKFFGDVTRAFVDKDAVIYSFLEKTGEMKIIDDDGNPLFGGL